MLSPLATEVYDLELEIFIFCHKRYEPWYM